MNPRAPSWIVIGLVGFASVGWLLAGLSTVTARRALPGTGPVRADLIDTILCAFTPDGAPPGFRAEMTAARARMHESMTDAPVTGDPDRDFASSMVPHHQGAIEMALVQLKYGRDERLRRLAQALVVEQGQEITYLRMILDGGPVANRRDRVTQN